MLAMMARKLHLKWAQQNQMEMITEEQSGLVKGNGGENEHKEISG
jgi:hypothetical protein